VPTGGIAVVAKIVAPVSSLTTESVMLVTFVGVPFCVQTFRIVRFIFVA
jgi:hypothetical protein